MATQFIVLILILIALILLGAFATHPVPRWMVIGLSVIALLLLVLGGVSFSIGR